jgi:hypothetical protein
MFTKTSVRVACREAKVSVIVRGRAGIGHESNLPFMGDSDAVRQGDVTLGELQFVSYEDKPRRQPKGLNRKDNSRPVKC